MIPLIESITNATICLDQCERVARQVYRRTTLETVMFATCAVVMAGCTCRYIEQSMPWWVTLLGVVGTAVPTAIAQHTWRRRGAAAAVMNDIVTARSTLDDTELVDFIKVFMRQPASTTPEGTKP